MENPINKLSVIFNFIVNCSKTELGDRLLLRVLINDVVDKELELATSGTDWPYWKSNTSIDIDQESSLKIILFIQREWREINETFKTRIIDVSGLSTNNTYNFEFSFDSEEEIKITKLNNDNQDEPEKLQEREDDKINENKLETDKRENDNIIENKFETDKPEEKDKILKKHQSQTINDKSEVKADQKKEKHIQFATAEIQKPKVKPEEPKKEVKKEKIENPEDHTWELDIPEEELEEYREAFNLFDKDGGGSISTDEFLKVLRNLGQKVTREEAAQISAELDSDGSGEIEFKEFVCYMKKIKAQEEDPGDADYDEELLKAFKYFDKNKDGTLSTDEFRYILCKLGGLRYTEEECDVLFNTADLNKDGKLNYREFIKFWKTK